MEAEVWDFSLFVCVVVCLWFLCFDTGTMEVSNIFIYIYEALVNEVGWRNLWHQYMIRDESDSLDHSLLSDFGSLGIEIGNFHSYTVCFEHLSSSFFFGVVWMKMFGFHQSKYWPFVACSSFSATARPVDLSTRDRVFELVSAPPRLIREMKVVQTSYLKVTLYLHWTWMVSRISDLAPPLTSCSN